MTSIDATTDRAAPASALRALWSARSWRATLHALAGPPLGIGGVVVIVGLVVVWSAAPWSLIEGPTGGWLSR